MAHPRIAADIAAANIAGVSHGKRGSALNRFENSIERTYIRDLDGRCQMGLEHKERRKEVEVGFFGIGANWEKVKEIDAEVVPSCEELKTLGVLRS
jgi:DnaJ family protein B protein 12